MDQPKVTEFYNAYSTTYLIEADTETKVDLAIEQLMGRYHPAGYGTRVQKKIRTATGWTAEVYRANSCD